jgi:hypothetical protein
MVAGQLELLSLCRLGKTHAGSLSSKTYRLPAHMTM